MDLEAIKAMLGPVGVVLGIWSTARANRRATRISAEQKLVEQYQVRQDEMNERIEQQQQRLDGQQAQIVRLAAMVAKLTNRDMLWDFHTTRLEAQVKEAGQEPYKRPEALRPLTSLED